MRVCNLVGIVVSFAWISGGVYEGVCTTNGIVCLFVCLCVGVRACVCVCVCVRVRERVRADYNDTIPFEETINALFSK